MKFKELILIIIAVKKYKKIYIEITNICNLACRFCPPTKRQPEMMTTGTFEKILGQIKTYTDYLHFHVKGEPLLHAEIDKLLDLSHQQGFQVNLTTNGTLIKDVGPKLLKKPALRQISFSLHSLDGNDGIVDRKEYLNNIFSFAKLATQEKNIIISLRLWNLSHDNVENQANKRNVQLLDAIEEEYKLPYKIEEKFIPGRGIHLAERIFLNQDRKFSWPDLNKAEDKSQGFCYGLRHQVAILVDGTVVPCCLDGEGILQLGNINNTDFSKIIVSERANNIHAGFSRREVVEELCRKCGYRKGSNE